MLLWAISRLLNRCSCRVSPYPVSDQPRQSGSTLIEMVMVIVITGIIGVISMRFISLYVSGWVDTSARSTLASSAWVASEQIARDIRRAMPNSLRSFSDGGQQCLEMVPVLAQGDYLSVPVGTAANTAEVVVLAGASAGDQGYVAVYPSSSQSVYGGQSVSSSLATLGAAVNNQQTLTFAAAENFPWHSPAQRIYFVSTPIAYCDDGSGRLWRYSGYGFAADSRPLLPATAAELVVDNLLPGSLRFDVSSAQLQRNAIAHVEFRTLRSSADGNQSGNAGEQLLINREVQLLNVP